MQHLDLELAHRFLQARLTPDQQRHWEQHLQGCERCRELVAAERALLAVLDLDAAAAVPPPATALRVPDEFAARDPQRARRRRWSIVFLAAEVLVATGLLAALVWQINQRSDPAAALARELRITPEFQQQLLVDLPALLALERDPWLADDYDTVATLAQLIQERIP